MHTSPAYESPYERQRKRSDLYLPAMNELAASLMFQNALVQVSFIPPTAYEDQRLGTDMHMSFERTRLSYRTRAYRYLSYFLDGFTLRTPHELDKVMKGTYADYLLYAVEHPTEPGSLEAGILIDMKAVGAQLNQYPEILEEATSGGDFVDLSYDSFPLPVVAAYAGIRPKQGRTYEKHAE